MMTYEYKEGLIAFLDILGITEAIKESKNDTSKTNAIGTLLDLTKSISDDISNSRKSWQIDISAFNFSDTIVIICPEISLNSFCNAPH